ncbi:hypothetical protein J6590_093412, partial [Homalodisca vitripennis]
VWSFLLLPGGAGAAGVDGPPVSAVAVQRSTQNWHGPGESDCLIKTKHCDVPHGALNVKVKKFKQARVNGGSNYDSLGCRRVGWLQIHQAQMAETQGPRTGNRATSWVRSSDSSVLGIASPWADAMEANESRISPDFLTPTIQHSQSVSRPSNPGRDRVSNHGGCQGRIANKMAGPPP